MKAKLDMLLGTLNRVKEVSQKFKNPSFKYYFYQKAEDTIKLLGDKKDTVTHAELDSLLDEYKDLEEVLNRQTTVQNMYYDDKPKVDK